MTLTRAHLDSAMTRAAAASAVRMIDDVVVTRTAGALVLDDDTGVLEPAESTSVYDGPGWLGPLAQTDPQTRPDTALTESNYELIVPLDAGPFQAGDIATVRSRTWRVEAVPIGSTQFDQRLPVEEVLDA